MESTYPREKEEADGFNVRSRCIGVPEQLRELPEGEALAKLWDVLACLEGETFYTARKLPFTYQLKGGELFVNRKKDSITRASVEMAFRNAMALNGEVSGPKKLKTFGASYLYPVFLAIGVIR